MCDREFFPSHPDGRPVLGKLMLGTVMLAVLMPWGDVSADTALRVGTPLLTAQAANPYTALGYPGTLTQTAVFDPLAVVDADGLVHPWLATEWVSDDMSQWLITLRENVLFSNGRRLDATALIRSVDHMRTVTGRAESIGSTLRDIQSIEAVSEGKVLVTLSEPDPVFPLRLSLWRIPEPDTFAAAQSQAHRTFAAGTGPFKMVSLSPERATLEANETSWRAPRVKHLDIIQISDQQARYQALASGDIDIALDVGIGSQNRLSRIGARLAPRRTRNIPFVAFALEHIGPSPVDDVRVRRALNYAVNKELITRIMFAGLVSPTGQLALPGAVGYDPSLGAYPYDPAEARRLLAEAGYADGFDITLRTSSGSADEISYIQQIVADLAAVNVRVTIAMASASQMTPMLFHGKVRAELFSMIARGLAPHLDYRFRSCLGLVGRFKPFFCDDTVNQLMKQAREAVTYAAMDAALRAVLRREHENPPGIFLWDSKTFDGVSQRVQGFESYTDFIALGNIALQPGSQDR